MKLTKINNLAVFLFILSYLGWAVFVYYSGLRSGDYSRATFSGIDVFYGFQSSFNSVVLPILPMFLLPITFGITSVFSKKSTFENFLIIRYGSRKQYLRHLFQKNFISVFAVVILWQILFLLVINLTMGSIIPTENPGTLMAVFSANGLVNMVIFIFLSAVGWGIFTNLVLAIGLFVKNPYLHLGTGVITGLLMMFVGTIIGSNRVGYATFLPVLTNPGNQQIGGNYPTPLWVTYLIAAVVYIGATSVIVYIYLRKHIYENNHS